MSTAPQTRVVVTGAGGMAGRVFLETLLARGFDAIGLSSQARPAEIPEGNWRTVDLLNDENLKRLILDLKPEVILHAASSVFVNECEPEMARPAIYKLHVHLTANLAALAAQLNAQMIYISTESVYDGTKTGLYNETDAPCPLNYYAQTKLEGEFEVQKLATKGLILRTNILGWRRDGRQSLLEWTLAGLQNKERRTMLTDVTFTPITTYQLADDVIGCIDKKLTGLFHAGGATSVSKYDVAVRLAEMRKLDQSILIPTTMDQISMGAPRPRNTALDSSKLAKALGKPRPKINETIERFFAKK